MPPGHRPHPAPSDADAIELDSDLLESETDRIELSPPAPPAPTQPPSIISADELPAGLAWHINRQWVRVRPHARALAEATAAALSALGKLVVRAAVHAQPHAHRLWQRLRQRWPLADRLWPGWPTSWRRLVVLAAGAFGVGALFVLPFALASRQGPPRPPAAVALERPPADNAPPADAVAGLQDHGIAPSPAKPHVASRAEVARQMAREAFEHQHWRDGVWYFRTARRAQRRAPGDDVLILSTIAALADREAAPPAKRLLRELGGEARAMLAETARSHPDAVVRGHAQELIRQPSRPRPFLRWVR
jgi:hypothetical protein